MFQKPLKPITDYHGYMKFTKKNLKMILTDFGNGLTQI